MCRILFLIFGVWALLAVAFSCSGCGNTSDTLWLSGGIAGGVALAGQSPAHEIEQIYYLGVFDPLEQTPSSIFRLTVRGQSSFMNATKFASGWAPANLVDSLNTNLSFTQEGVVAASKEEAAELSELETGRRLILFGPEGYRETPRSHRLVMVMSSSPEKFFEALGQTLGTIADVQIKKLDERLHQEVFRSLVRVRDEQKRLESLREVVRRDVIGLKGGI